MQTIHLVVASQNPVKLKASKQGLQALWPNATINVVGESFPAGVPDQPMSNTETFTGAFNRANNAYKHHKDAYDFYIGIEGGVHTEETLHEPPHNTCLFTWVVIMNKHGKHGKARTSPLFLPPKIVKLLRGGYELGDADDMTFGTTNSKQNNGTLGILTDNALDRTSYTAQAITLAAVPFFKPELY